jgi:hypothetical protein
MRNGLKRGAEFVGDLSRRDKGDIPDKFPCLFHNSLLRCGGSILTQRRKDAETREGKTVRISGFRFRLRLGF